MQLTFSNRHQSIQTRGTLLVVLVFLFGSFGAFAQKKTRIGLIQAWTDHHIQVDGSLTEWNLQQFHSVPDRGFSFDLRNDAHNLYLAIQVEQAELQPRVLAQGLQFGINRSGKKKEDLSIRFPVVDRLALRELMKQEMDERPDDYRVAALKQVKGIEVKGFEHLLDGMLSLNNQYGIRAGAQLNDGMDLLFIEIQIPLRHLNLSGKQQSSELAFNLLVGAPAVTGPRSGEDGAQDQTMGGYGGYPSYYPGDGYYPNGGLSNRPTRPRLDPGFWGTFKLATAINN